jgi:hypothetical protein
MAQAACIRLAGKATSQSRAQKPFTDAGLKPLDLLEIAHPSTPLYAEHPKDGGSLAGTPPPSGCFPQRGQRRGPCSRNR